MDRMKLKEDASERRCKAEYAVRYYSEMRDRYERNVRRIEILVTSISAISVLMLIDSNTKQAGAYIAVFASLLSVNIIPKLGWKEYAAGFKEEVKDWTRLRFAYEKLIHHIDSQSPSEEILNQFYLDIEKDRETVAINGRSLPDDSESRKRHEAAVRRYYQLDAPVSGAEVSNLNH